MSRFCLDFSENVQHWLDILLSWKFKSWNERRELSETVWSESRKILFESVLKKHVVHGKCHVCCERDAIICCKDCNRKLYCFVCDDVHHDINPYHNRLSFTDGFLSPISPLECFNENMELQHIGMFS